MKLIRPIVLRGRGLKSSGLEIRYSGPIWQRFWSCARVMGRG